MSDRFITAKDAWRLTRLSPREQGRKQGFPRAIKLGPGKQGRIAYLLSEIEEWQAKQIAKRNAANLDAFLQRIKPFAAHNIKDPP